MEIRHRDFGRHRILEVHGEINLYNVGELKKAMFDLIEKQEVKSLIMDLKNVAYMDSSGLGALVAAHKKMKSRGGEFGLLNLQEDVYTVMRLATLDSFFVIYENEQQLEGVA